MLHLTKTLSICYSEVRHWKNDRCHRVWICSRVIQWSLFPYPCIPSSKRPILRSSTEDCVHCVRIQSSECPIQAADQVMYTLCLCSRVYASLASLVFSGSRVSLFALVSLVSLRDDFNLTISLFSRQLFLPEKTWAFLSEENAPCTILLEGSYFAFESHSAQDYWKEVNFQSNHMRHMLSDLRWIIENDLSGRDYNSR